MWTTKIQISLQIAIEFLAILNKILISIDLVVNNFRGNYAINLSETTVPYIINSQRNHCIYSIVLRSPGPSGDMSPMRRTCLFVLTIHLAKTYNCRNLQNFGDAGLELATSWSQTKRSSHLS